MFAPTNTRHHRQRIVNTTTEAIGHVLRPGRLWPYQRWACLKVSKLRKCLNLFWWSEIKLKATRRPRSLICFFGNWTPGMVPRRSMLSANESWQGPNVSYTAQERPCLLYNEYNSTVKAFRNILGMTLLNGSKLNTWKLAPWRARGMFLPSDQKCFPQVRWSVEKLRDPKSPLSTTHGRVLKWNPHKTPRIVLKLNPYAKTRSRNNHSFLEQELQTPDG